MEIVNTRMNEMWANAYKRNCESTSYFMEFINGFRGKQTGTKTAIITETVCAGCGRYDEYDFMPGYEEIGADVREFKFCPYCGTRLEEQTKTVEYPVYETVYESEDKGAVIAKMGNQL